MIKKSIIGIGFCIITSLLLSGCAFKTDSGANGYGSSYTDIPSDTNKQNNKNCSCNQVPEEIPTPKPMVKEPLPKNTPVLKCNAPLIISVVGQGVAPCKGACSPAKAYALAKRAAIADSYRLIAERVKGVYVEGQDYIKNMAVKNSTVRTYVRACIRNASITDTTFKDGLCEVEMEVSLYHSDFTR